MTKIWRFWLSMFVKRLPQQKMTVVNAQTLDEYDVELHEYANEDEELMCVEHCGNWLTFYVGALIAQPDVNVYPAEEEAEYI